MSTLKFLGASGTVTGSSYLLTANSGEQILIDLGAFQGREEIVALNYQKLQFEASHVQAVLLTHAHIDHCGRLPILMRHGFGGKVYMTEATKALLDLSLHDSAKIQLEDYEHEPMFSEADVEALLKHVATIPYDKVFSEPPFKFQFLDPGHILGAASILVTDTTADQKYQRIIFSGDLGNDNKQLLRPTELIGRADIAVVESTYGDRNHVDEDPMQIIQQEINAIEKTAKTLLIPSFSIEKSQEILHIIDHLKKQNLVKNETKVFLDSPMSIHATQIYKQFKQLYGEELAEHAKKDDPFDFPGLTLTQSSSASKQIRGIKEAKVIVASSGMMSGGRILFHARNYLPDSQTHLLFTGYQAEGTLGREILEGALEVTIFDQTVPVKAQIRSLQALSSHADQSQLLKWLSTMKGLKKVFITHGEKVQRTTFQGLIKEKLGVSEVYTPSLGEVASF
jgi:metallo-beta-lactamase family protein